MQTDAVYAVCYNVVHKSVRYDFLDMNELLCDIAESFSIIMFLSSGLEQTTGKSIVII